jgi:GT2 family glycosyltransferase
LGRCFRELDLNWPAEDPGSGIDDFLRPDLRHNPNAVLEPGQMPFGFPAQAFYEELRNGYPEHSLSSQIRNAVAEYTRSSTVLVKDVEKHALAYQRLSDQHCSLEQAYHRLEAVYRGTEPSNTTQNEDMETLCRERETLTQWAAHLQAQHRDLLTRFEHLTARQQAMAASWSWRLTAPLRLGVVGARMFFRGIGIGLFEFPHVVKTVRAEGISVSIRAAVTRLRQESHPAGAIAVAREQPRTISARQAAKLKSAYQQEKQADLEAFLSRGDVLDLTAESPARVAVVLVLFNRAELTLACLQSLQKNGGMPVELIIVDNASTDNTGELLDRIRGARILRNMENLHYLKACNQAGDVAQSEFLLFLNNDAKLREGSLQAALRVFDTESGVGAVGGKLLLLDGSLQEAGCIVWNDGSCLGYGRGADPAAPEYNFRRDVDFCSGAFLLTPLARFRELGGFDDRYAPAYYEETDYCMRLKSLGYRVVYEPLACIEHVEFASSLEASHPIDQQIRNQKHFVEQHTETLQRHLLPDPGSLLKARFTPPAPRRVLYVDDRIPHPALGSGFPRAKRIVNTLVDLGYAVTLVPLNFPQEDTIADAHQVISPRVEVMRGCGRADLGRFLASRPSYFDVLWVSRPDNMEIVRQCLDAHPDIASGLWVVYDAEAIFSMREKGKAALSGTAISGEAFSGLLQREMDLTTHADAIVSVSEPEADEFRRHRAGARNVVIGHALEGRPTPAGFAERADLLFVGNLQLDDTPNVDSVVWFVEEAWAVLRERIPGIRLHVIGHN